MAQHLEGGAEKAQRQGAGNQKGAKILRKKHLVPPSKCKKRGFSALIERNDKHRRMGGKEKIKPGRNPGKFHYFLEQNGEANGALGRGSGVAIKKIVSTFEGG